MYPALNCSWLISTVCWNPFRSSCGELQRGFGQQHADEFLAHIEGQTALSVGHLGACHRRCVPCSLQTVLTFLTPLEQVAESNVELLSLVEIIAGEILRAEKRNELRVYAEYWIRPQVGRDLLCLVLLNLRACGLQGVIVSEGQLNRLV